MSEPSHNWVKEEQVRLVSGTDLSREGSVRWPVRTSSLSHTSQGGSAIAAVLSSYRFSVASSLLTIDEVPFVGFADEEEVPALLAATTTTITTTTSGRRKSVGEEESELRLREIENDLGEIMERKARVEKRVEALKEQMGELEEECKTTWELREEGGALEKEKGTRMKGAAVKFEREKRRWSLRWELKRMWRVWRA